jgi:hypothetical protein
MLILRSADRLEFRTALWFQASVQMVIFCRRRGTLSPPSSPFGAKPGSGPLNVFGKIIPRQKFPSTFIASVPGKNGLPQRWGI